MNYSYKEPGEITQENWEELARQSGASVQDCKLSYNNFFEKYAKQGQSEAVQAQAFATKVAPEQLSSITLDPTATLGGLGKITVHIRGSFTSMNNFDLNAWGEIEVDFLGFHIDPKLGTLHLTPSQPYAGQKITVKLGFLSGSLSTGVGVKEQNGRAVVYVNMSLSLPIVGDANSGDIIIAYLT